jgi:AraC-like DNA-binding protein
VPHYHEHIELLFADGECDATAWIAGTEVRMNTGDLIIINSNVAHTFIFDRSDSNYICVKTLPDMVYSPQNAFFDMKYVLPFFEDRTTKFCKFRASDKVFDDIAPAFERILHEWKNKRYGYEIAIRTEVLSAFLWVIRNLPRGDLELMEEQASDYNATLIRRSLEQIDARYADITEAQAAQYVNMSRSHYSRQFRAVMGKSFCEYVNILRINAAERLLLTGNDSVTEIALACGFATSSHFIESFKRQKGSTPGKYRKMWANDQRTDAEHSERI